MDHNKIFFILITTLLIKGESKFEEGIENFQKKPLISGFFCGEDGSRTHDLLTASQAL